MSFNVFPEQSAHQRRYNYRVAIATSIITGSNQGFVDHLSQRYYGANGGHSSTQNNVLAKERSNMRWENIIIRISENATPVDIVNISNGSATADAVGSGFAFTISYDRPDYLYTYNELFGTGHSTTALQVLTDPLVAIKRQVARTFVWDISGQREVYNVTTKLDDWTNVTAAQFSTSSDPIRTRIEAIEPGITVTAVTTANP